MHIDRQVALQETFLLSSIYIRKKNWIRENFWYLIFDRPLHSKRNLKGNYYMSFEENHSNKFFETCTSKFKIGLPNLDFHEFFYGNRLIHFEKHVKRCFYIGFWRKSFEPFLRYSHPVSLLVCPTPLLVFRFSPKPDNIIYAHVWYYE